MMQPAQNAIFSVFYSLAALQGIWTFVALLAIPSDPKNAVFLGLSAERLLMLSVPLTISAGSAWLAVDSWRRSKRAASVARRIQAQLDRPHLWGVLILICAIFLAIGGLVHQVQARESLYVLAPPGNLPEHEISAYFVNEAFFKIELYLERVIPLVNLVIGLALQTALAIPLIRFGLPGTVRFLKEEKILAVFVLFGLFLLTWSLLGWRTLKIQPDAIGWNTPGAPLLDTNLVFAILAGLLMLAIGPPLANWLRARGSLLRGRLDIVLFAVIWLSAGMYWMNLPLNPSWFLEPPAAPNYEFYPRADAAIYDSTAQNMLIGEGLKSYASNEAVVRRPLYTFFIGVLHILAGQDYLSLANLQSFLLAVFPALVYLITRQLHSRLSGIIAAIFITLREGNAIMLSREITISHSRLLMSDLPAATMMAIIVWLALNWLTAPDSSSRVKPLVIGALVGGAMLIRIEIALVAPLVLFFAWLKLRPIRSAFLPAAGALLLGVILCLSPWLYRNYQRNGELYLEAPGNRISFFFNRLFKDTGSEIPAKNRALLRVLDVRDQQSLSPEKAVLNHFLNSNMQSVLILPSAYRGVSALAGWTQHGKVVRLLEDCCSRSNYIQRLPFWLWYKWDMVLPAESVFPIAASLLLLAVGVIAAWKTRRRYIWLPILVGEAHILINALARTSGGRYMLTTDWIWISFYAIGLGQLLIWLNAMFRTRSEPQAFSPGESATQSDVSRKSPGFVAVCLIIVTIAAAMPTTESFFPQRFGPDVSIDSVEKILADPETGQEVRTLLENGGTVFQGRALYPRYYPSGAYYTPDEDAPFYGTATPGFFFRLIGADIREVILPLTAGLPGPFPNATDALVIGCEVKWGREPFVIAGFLYLPETGQTYFDEAILGSLDCKNLP